MTYLREDAKTLALALTQAVSVVDPDGVIEGLADDLSIYFSELKTKPNQMEINAAVSMALLRVFGYERITRHFLGDVAEAIHNSTDITERQVSAAESDAAKVKAAGISPTFADLLINGTEEEIELGVRIFLAVQDLEKRVREKGLTGGVLRLEGKTAVPAERATELAEKLTKEFSRNATATTIAV
jgi:hypothetical protein